MSDVNGQLVRLTVSSCRAFLRTSSGSADSNASCPPLLRVLNAIAVLIDLVFFQKKGEKLAADLKMLQVIFRSMCFTHRRMKRSG